MKVSELIKFLEKCKPSAEVTFCDYNGHTDAVHFVEHCTTYNQVLLYEGEPNWDEYPDDEPTSVIDTIVRTGDCFVETTYRELADEN